MIYQCYFTVICLKAEVSSNSEVPKPASKLTDLHNPSELIKQAQKESVSSSKENKKVTETEGVLAWK